ncbi:putative glycoside hydrolase [Candidatus Margulisiibacteriota bacterium]
MLCFLLALSFCSEARPLGRTTKPKRRSERGVYLTSYTASSPVAMARIKEQAQKSGLNTFVIEAKSVLKKPLLALARERKLSAKTKVAPDPWLSQIVEDLHKDGFIVSVRLVVFKDDHLIIARPDLAIRVKGGQLYRDLMEGRWCDPYSDEVRLYNELIAEVAALSGVDEVQFDYIRFPAEGKAHLAYYPFYKEGVSRPEIINEFLRSARERLKKYNVSIAVDIFGVTAWQSVNDKETLGQDLKGMAQYIDVLSPMFYPSHFHSGYDDFANPGAHPYYFVNTGVKKARQILSNEAVSVVPWIQGFNLRSPNFGPGYMWEQIRACRNEGVNAFLVWNANNDYWATYSALQKN